MMPPHLNSMQKKKKKTWRLMQTYLGGNISPSMERVDTILESVRFTTKYKPDALA